MQQAQNRKLKVLLSLVLLPVLSACTTPTNNSATDEQVKPRVVIISIDGFRHDYPELHQAQAIQKLGEQGVRSKGLQPVYPSKTFPNHLSIVTGRYPTKHGLVDNFFYDKEREQTYGMGDGLKDSTWITAMPLWNLAEFQGVKAATFFWPESDARISGRTPSYFYHYSTPASNQQRVDQIVEWLQLPLASQPQLVFGYFSVVDTMGHRFGPEAQQTKKAAQYIDGLIGQLYERLQTEVDEPVNLILVADHGMSLVKGDEAYANDIFAVDEDKFKVVNGSTRMMFYALEETTPEEIAAQRQQIAEQIADDDMLTLASPQALNDRGYVGGPRVADIIVDTHAPHTFSSRPAEERRDGGTHGFYGTREMDGLFVAVGPAFKDGLVIDRFENIHIYPLVADLLGLELLTPIDGEAEVLAPILRAE